MKILELLRYSVWALWEKRAMRLPPAKIQAIQERRLRRMLRLAAERSPFYRRKFRGADVATCRLADLPTTDKNELMDHFDQVVTDPRVRLADLEAYMHDPDNAARPYLGRYSLCHTSGSSGRPLVVVNDPQSLDVLFMAQLLRGNVQRPGVLGALRGLFRRGRLAVLAMTRGFFPSSATWNHVPRPARAYLDLLWVTPTDPHLIDKLNAFRPTALTAYTSVLEALALQKDRLRLAPELRQVVSNSEVLTDRARAAFREAFGVPVLDNYSMAECIFISNGCPTDPGAHVNADWVVLEVVDEAGRPVAPGQTGHKILLTNLANDVMPFIRYEIGDRVAWATVPCRCGSLLPRLETIGGRTADYFWVRENGRYRQVLSFVFKTAFEAVHEAREWQVVQEERNRIRARLEPMPGAALAPEKPLRLVREQLDSLGLADAVRVEIDIVPRLEADSRTKKFRRIISLVGPPEDLEQSFRAAPRHAAPVS